MMMETFENMTTTKELTQAYSKVDSSLELMNGQAQSEKALGRIKEVRFIYSAFSKGYHILELDAKYRCSYASSTSFCHRLVRHTGNS